MTTSSALDGPFAHRPAASVTRVAVTGANGAVGRAILRRAWARAPLPVEIVAVVRSERAAAALRPLLGPGDRVVVASYAEPASLETALRGSVAVAHLAGVLAERRDASYEQANRETARRVIEAAKGGGVAKLVLVSAVGADASSPNRYWRTKGEAEALVRASGLDHTVLRVPLLLGHGTEGALTLRRRLARRAVTLIAGGRALQQPLDVDDLAHAVIAACDPATARGHTLDLVGPVVLSDREIVERAARLPGRRLRIRSVPARLVRLALTVRRWLGGTGFSTDALDVVTAGTTTDPAPAARALGIELTGLDDMLRHSLEPEAQP